MMWRPLAGGGRPAHGQTVVAYGRDDKGVWFIVGTYRRAHPEGITERWTGSGHGPFHLIDKFTHYCTLEPPLETL